MKPDKVQTLLKDINEARASGSLSPELADRTREAIMELHNLWRGLAVRNYPTHGRVQYGNKRIATDPTDPFCYYPVAYSPMSED